MASQHWELVCWCYISNPSKAELILSLLSATNVQQNLKLFVFVYMSPSLSTLDKRTAVISSSSCTGRAHPKRPFQNMVDNNLMGHFPEKSLPGASLLPITVTFTDKGLSNSSNRTGKRSKLGNNTNCITQIVPNGTLGNFSKMNYWLTCLEKAST